MREKNHNYRRKARNGATGPVARTEEPVYTAGRRETRRQVLRILARLIAHAHAHPQKMAHCGAPSPGP